MTNRNLTNTRKTYQFQTMLYVLGMAAVLGSLGYAFLGINGVIWALTFFVLAFVMGRRVTTQMIMRFYRARPLVWQEAPDLFRMIQDLAQRADLPKVPRLYYLPSGALNAFATGDPKDPAIAVTAGLMRNVSARELAGILAHEISHIRNRDLELSRLTQFMDRMTQMFIFAAQILIFFNIPALVQGAEVPFSWWGILLMFVAPYLSKGLQMAISRTRELDADLEAVRLTGDPNGLANALERIEWLNRGGMGQWFRPRRKVRIPSWLMSHPSTKYRVARLRKLA